jgi:aspartyl protease family protein
VLPGETRVFRFLVIAAIVVGAALAAPRFLPGLLTAATDQIAASDVDETDAAPEPAEAAVAPVAAAAPLTAEADLPTTESPAPTGRRAAIAAAPDGHFYADAIINGRTVPVVVDTGATVVVLTEATANRLGIFPPRSAFTERVQTANGEVEAALVRLREIRLGNVRVADVEALVLPGESLALNLLGMSFLGRLAGYEASGGKLILTQ